MENIHEFHWIYGNLQKYETSTRWPTGKTATGQNNLDQERLVKIILVTDCPIRINWL
jgi:hypothetical protein